MYYDYKISDINGRNQMYDVIDLNVNTKRCRIMRKDLEQVFKISGVGLDKLDITTLSDFQNDT